MLCFAFCTTLVITLADADCLLAWSWLFTHSQIADRANPACPHTTLIISCDTSVCLQGGGLIGFPEVFNFPFYLPSVSYTGSFTATLCGSHCGILLCGLIIWRSLSGSLVLSLIHYSVLFLMFFFFFPLRGT